MSEYFKIVFKILIKCFFFYEFNQLLRSCVYSKLLKTNGYKHRIFNCKWHNVIRSC